MTTIANFTVEGPVGSGSAGGNPVLGGVLDGNGNTIAVVGNSNLTLITASGATSTQTGQIRAIRRDGASRWC